MTPTFPKSSNGNGHADLDGSLRFQVIGDIAHAAHFVTANWPRPSTKPTLDSQAQPMTLAFRLTTETVRDLQDTLTKATLLDSPLANSARAFRMMLATRLAGRRIPDFGVTPESRETRAG